MYICTFPGMRTLKLFCAASAILLASLPSSAQSVRTNSSSAQAELHITAIVAPVIIPPRRDRHRDRDHDSVSYNLGPQEQKLSVTEEVRPMRPWLYRATNACLESMSVVWFPTWSETFQ